MKQMPIRPHPPRNTELRTCLGTADVSGQLNLQAAVVSAVLELHHPEHRSAVPARFQNFPSAQRYWRR